VKCLWIEREIPFPPNAGDHIYTAQMAAALARSGVEVHMLGFAPENVDAVPVEWPVRWYPLRGARTGNVRALFSSLPLNAATHATCEFRSMLRTFLAQPWDAIILDHYSSGWALDLCRKAEGRQRPPVLVYLSHNHEETVWRSLLRDQGSVSAKQLVLWQNALKVRSLERKLVDKVDLIGAITSDDAALYASRSGSKPIVVLPPGYSGRICPSRLIAHDTPRRVVLIGSFTWVVKQENLRAFLEAADERFTAAGIEFDIIGKVPESLRANLAHYRSAHFHGFVEDVSEYFARARVAIVPELIGGGFKLKYLDYIFARLPVAGVTSAALALPERIRVNTLMADNQHSLAETIATVIDDLGTLNRLQQQAFEAAQTAFSWDERGQELRSALERARRR
jgi:polysaccharide biosynthesis protein PslH